MKNLFMYFLVLAILPTLLFTNCKDKTEDDVVVEYEVLSKYLNDNGLNLSDVLSGWVKPGSTINVDTTDYSVSDYYVIDLRSATDFDDGHIKNAHNTTLGNVLTEAENAGTTPILVVCYTGQTAARATAALRLAGKTAYCLKWGMCGWHANLNGKWQANATDYATTNWVTDGTPAANSEFDFPKLSTGETEGAKILEKRIAAMLAMDWKVSKTDVLANPGNYFINNFWPEVSWNEYGHITGAYRIKEDLGELKYLDPNKTIVTYCYTGQTSSIITGFLQTVGYDNARSLLFGANGIIWSTLKEGNVDGGHKKSWHGESSASGLNFGYYKTDGTFVNPL